MAHDISAASAARTLPISADADVLRQLAAASVAAFAKVTDGLSAIREVHGAIGGDLEAFATLVAEGGSGAGELQALEQAIRDMAEALAEAGDASARAASRVHLRTARDYLDQISGQGVALSAVASLSRTTAASLGISSLGAYLRDLTAAAGAIGDAATRVNHGLEAVTGRQSAAEGSHDRAREAIERLAPRCAERLVRLETLAQEEAGVARAIGQQAGTLAHDGRAMLKVFVTAMQFSDRLTQRLDHIRGMLDHGTGCTRRLASAQLTSCAADARRVAGEVRTAMRALADHGRRGAALFASGQIAEAIDAGLALRRETAGIVLSDVARVREAIERADAEADFIETTTRAAQQDFAALEASAKRVGIASINAMLLSARAGDTRGPLSVLAQEVRQVATRCLAAVGGSEASLNALVGDRENARETLREGHAAIDARVSAFAAVTEAEHARLARINELRDSATGRADLLVERAGAVEAAMDAVEVTGSALSALAETLAAGAGTQAPDFAVLARVWDSYTMDEERQVHAAVFSEAPAAAEAPKAASGAAGLDDVLF